LRSGQSPVHEAIQEALVNSLIHADYRGMGGVVIERFADRNLCHGQYLTADQIGSLMDRLILSRLIARIPFVGNI